MLTDRTDMTLDVYRGRNTTMQQQQHKLKMLLVFNNWAQAVLTSLAGSKTNILSSKHCLLYTCIYKNSYHPLSDL